MNTALSLRIDHALSLEEGFLMSLQVYYDIKIEKKRMTKGLNPDQSLLRKGLFWDTKMEAIDWIAQKEAVINRINERGNQQEQDEINRFYNSEEVKQHLQTSNNSFALNG